MIENPIAYFLMSKIPFALLLGMLLASAAVLYGEARGLAATGGEGIPIRLSLRGGVGQLLLAASCHVMLCVILSLFTGIEVWKAIRDGQRALAGLYALPVVALGASVLLLGYQMRALVQLTCHPVARPATKR